MALLTVHRPLSSTSSSATSSSASPTQQQEQQEQQQAPDEPGGVLVVVNVSSDSNAGQHCNDDSDCGGGVIGGVHINVDNCQNNRTTAAYAIDVDAVDAAKTTSSVCRWLVFFPLLLCEVRTERRDMKCVHVCSSSYVYSITSVCGSCVAHECESASASRCAHDMWGSF